MPSSNRSIIIPPLPSGRICKNHISKVNREHISLPPPPSRQCAKNIASPQALRKKTARSSSQNRIGVTLRYGETIESLFCLPAKSSSSIEIVEHYQLCQDIVNGKLTNDAKSWLKSINFAKKINAKRFAGAPRPSSTFGIDLIRLHRRATSKLEESYRSATSPNNHFEDSIGNDYKQEKNLLAIWLSFAKVQHQHLSAASAKQTYKHVVNWGIGKLDARLYTEMAEFEILLQSSSRKVGCDSGVTNAKQILYKGLEYGANPRQLILDMIDSIKNGEFNGEGINEIESSGCDVKSDSGSCARRKNISNTNRSRNLESNSSSMSSPSCIVPPLPTSAKPSHRQKERTKAHTGSQILKSAPTDLSKPSHLSRSNNDLDVKGVRYVADSNILADSTNVVREQSKQFKNKSKHSTSNDRKLVELENKGPNLKKILGRGQKKSLTKYLPSHNDRKDRARDENTAKKVEKSDIHGILESKKNQMRQPCSNNKEDKSLEYRVSIPSDFCNESDDPALEMVYTSNGATAKGRSKFEISRPKTRLTVNTPSTLKAKLVKSSGKQLLGGKRLGGGAVRVSFKDVPKHVASENDGSDVDQIGIHNYSHHKKQKVETEKDSSKPLHISSKPSKTLSTVPKLSRMDLGYMMTWDPEEYHKTKLKGNQDKPSVLDIIDEATNEGHNRSSSGSMSTNSTSLVESNEVTPSDLSRNSGGDNSAETNNSKKMTSSIDSQDATSARLSGSYSVNSHPSPMEMLISRTHPDFLPLVSEDNILRVNSIPFAKLGVIGKGGSCKVYRVLSKECQVLAIKKVKLNGMEQSTIDSYANEIALLKKLRGNPAIIQMFDSEVDRSRNAIFLVMEVGEVDLNHVLQQQATISGHRDTMSSRRILNMNFIRLTWQQMLSAVHSIHEERIIHGDLKPANFLFVRGALKLIDFGIAKAMLNEDTTNIYRDSQIGTLNYMSPEAILDTDTGDDGSRRMKLGRASDIWSLGCILYQMVYGKTPFANLHMVQKLQAIINPAHKIQFPYIPDEAAINAIQLCLRRQAEARPQIMGKNGLLNSHYFLHSNHTKIDVT